MNKIKRPIHTTMDITLNGQLNSCCIPHKITDKIRFDEDTIALSVEATQVIDAINKSMESYGGQSRALQFFITMEGIYSSKIENLSMSASSILAQDILGFDTGGWKTAIDINACIASMREANDRIGDGQAINEGFIKSLHLTLMDTISGYKFSPGQYRDSQVFIQSSDLSIAHVPPRPPEMRICMEELGAFLTSQGDMDPIISAGLTHFQFESIHPFRDGNGRVGRMLMLFQLIYTHTIQNAIFPVSKAIWDTRDEYYRYLSMARDMERYDPWMQYILQTFSYAGREAIRIMKDVKDLERSYEKYLNDMPRGNQVLNALFKNPVFNTQSIMNTVSLSEYDAKHLIAKLEEYGIISEVRFKEGELTPEQSKKAKGLYEAGGIIHLWES